MLQGQQRVRGPRNKKEKGRGEGGAFSKSLENTDSSKDKGKVTAYIPLYTTLKTFWERRSEVELLLNNHMSSQRLIEVLNSRVSFFFFFTTLTDKIDNRTITT